MDLFSFYSQWVPRFSDQVRLLSFGGDHDFPLSEEAVASFEGVKKCIADACIAIRYADRRDGCVRIRSLCFS